MKKILVIAYFYPPANFVGAERISSWAENLHNYGYYPIIITRNWNYNQTDLTNKIEDNGLHHEVFSTYEIYRLPYHRSLRDKLNDYPNNTILRILRKSLSALELILSNFLINYIPYSNIFYFAKEIINKTPDIKTVIVSGRPFQLFYFAHRLKKENSINWIADYRDEWSTHANRKPNSILERLICLLELNSEKKWTSNCDAFLSVSNQWVNNISNLIHKPGYRVMNGYNPNDFTVKKGPIDKSKFTITYNGTLYPSQRIEIFLSAAKLIMRKYKDSMRVQIQFIGVAASADSTWKLKEAIRGYESNFLISDRIPKKEVIEKQIHSDLLLLTGYENMKGWYPVKMFEYFACKTPVLLCPSDKDVMEKFVIDTGCGYVINSVRECYDILEMLIEDKLNDTVRKLPRNTEKALDYTRQNQAKILATVISKIESSINS